jgi:hypothetical protein
MYLFSGNVRFISTTEEAPEGKKINAPLYPLQLESKLTPYFKLWESDGETNCQKGKECRRSFSGVFIVPQV